MPKDPKNCYLEKPHKPHPWVETIGQIHVEMRDCPGIGQPTLPAPLTDREELLKAILGSTPPDGWEGTVAHYSFGEVQVTAEWGNGYEHPSPVTWVDQAGGEHRFTWF
jgi:hypothetical protein